MKRLLIALFMLAASPAQAELVILGVGQSNMYNGGKGYKAGIGQQFTRRMKEKYPGREVVYVQVAKGGQAVAQFMPESRLYWRMTNQTKDLPPVNYLLVHQGEADRENTYEDWSGSWNTIIASLRADGVINNRTVILFGEMARDGEGSTQNAAIQYINGAIQVSSKGLPMRDSLHFTRAGLNTFGDRYFKAAMQAN